MPDHVETEFKLRARQPLEVAAIDAALREFGAGCRRAESRRHTDVYLDDARGSLAQAGIGLRLRADPSGRQLACKGRPRTAPDTGNGTANGDGRTAAAEAIAGPASVRDGLFVRTELQTSWAGQAPPRRAGELAAELRDAVEPFVLDRPLVATLQLDVQREVRVLQHEAHDLCELAIDRVVATAAGRSANFEEVEIEVFDDVASNERLAHELSERLPLAFAEHDKPTHAAALLGIERPAPQRTEGLELEPAGRAIARRVEARLLAMRIAEVGVRSGDAPEPLHQMRVALRRLRTLIRAFGELWAPPTAARLLEALGETGRRLGALRDLDVMVDVLPAEIAALPDALRAAGERALAWLRTRRDTTRRQVQRWLSDPPRLASETRIEDDLRAIALDTEAARQPLSTAAPIPLARAVARLRKQIAALPAELPIEPAHRLRLAAKRVRYLAEEFRDLPEFDIGKALRRVVALQQSFGVVCDHEVAAQRLIGWVHAAARETADGALTAAALGALATRHLVAAGAARESAARSLDRVDRKAVWRRFPAHAASDADLA